MFSPISIKHECMGVEEVSAAGRTTADNSKYPIFANQDVDYKYHQLSQFWNHTQIQNEAHAKHDTSNHQNGFQPDETGSLVYVKDYAQNGILCQVSQQQEGHQNQLNHCHQETMQESETQSQLMHSLQQSKIATQMLTVTQSGMKHSRPGRPSKESSELSIGKRLKCQCEICFKEFGHKSNLFIHMRTHNGERPYKCNQCEKCFTHSGNLAIHMRTHSGERPYGCQICGKMFSHSGNLSTHLRTHSGVKPYKCNICGKEFRHSGNLSIHERIHSGIKPFQCKVCGKDFYHSGNLTTHMKKHSVNINANGNECENNESQIVCNTTNLTEPTSLNSYSSLIPTPVSNVKLISNTNIVPIKNESHGESVSNTIGILPQSSSSTI